MHAQQAIEIQTLAAVLAIAASASAPTMPATPSHRAQKRNARKRRAYKRMRIELNAIKSTATGDTLRSPPPDFLCDETPDGVGRGWYETHVLGGAS